LRSPPFVIIVRLGAMRLAASIARDMTSPQRLAAFPGRYLFRTESSSGKPEQTLDIGDKVAPP
jgi:hypothetical protein